MENSNLGNVTNITEYLSTTSAPILAFTEIPTKGVHVMSNRNIYGRKVIFNGTKQPEPFLLDFIQRITNNAGVYYYLQGINIPDAAMYFLNYSYFGSTIAIRGYSEIYTLREVKLYPRIYTAPKNGCYVNPVYSPTQPNHFLATETNDWITGYSASGVEEDYEI